MEDEGTVDSSRETVASTSKEENINLQQPSSADDSNHKNPDISDLLGAESLPKYVNLACDKSGESLLSEEALEFSSLLLKDYVIYLGKDSPDVTRTLNNSSAVASSTSCDESSIEDNRNKVTATPPILSPLGESLLSNLLTDEAWIEKYGSLDPPCDIRDKVHELCKCSRNIEKVIPHDHVVHLDTVLSTDDSPDDSFTLCDMPIEIIWKILSYLTPMELCKCVAPVCKVWYQFAYSPCLWQALNFSEKIKLESGNLCRLLIRTPQLKHLNLRGRDITAAEAATFAPICKMLTTLELGFCTTLDFEILEIIFRHCRKIESLNIEGCQQVNQKMIESIVNNLPNLHTLNLAYCTMLGDESMVPIALGLKRLLNLNIDGIGWITDSSIRLLKENQPYVQKLRLDGAELTDDSIDYLTTCSHLKVLGISFAEMLTDNSLDYIKNMSQLEELQLRKGLELTSSAFQRMFSAGYLKRLQKLDLSECSHLDDSCIDELVKCCGATLRSLSLCWCWNITDLGLISLVDHCPKMEYLDLMGNDVINGVCLDRIPEEMPHLTFLGLCSCNRIDDEMVMDILRIKRGLTVIGYYGEVFQSSDGFYVRHPETDSQ